MKRYFNHKYFLVSLFLLGGFTGSLSWGQAEQQPKSSIGLLGSGGYVIETVEKGKKGEKVGLRVGATILEVNERRFTSLSDFKSLFATEKVTNLGLARVTNKEYRIHKLALENVAAYQDLGITGSLAYIVQKVLPDSPASEAGFQPGDAIIEVNEQPFSSLEEFSLAMSMKEPGTQLLLKVQRQDEDGLHRYTLSIKTVPFWSVKRP